MIDYDLLNAIPPDCNYNDWLQVGMALKHEGADVSVWDNWSRSGSKYKQGECERKWRTFRSEGVTGGTLYYIAESYGYRPKMTTEVYDLHNLLLDEVIVDQSFIDRERIPGVPENYNAKGEMLEYFKALFHEDDFVGYCVKFRDDKDGRLKPAETMYRRTAGDIIKKLQTGTITDAIGTLDSRAGAYVRFNPLDGEGENNKNVTRWDYCLVESDEDDIEKQYSLYKAMNLPIRFLVHSGSKSLHAIVKIDADNPQQYRTRVRELYEFCKKNGLHPDEQDKNESRFSRLPGVQRNGKWQYIVERDIGARSYDEWIDWRQTQVDDLPPEDNLEAIWNELPPLRDELIPGVLRTGHKMLVAGPSKAGKSFLLINLAVSIAEGIDWIGMKCKQGKVVYVNLELDRASCLHRVKEIYEKRGLSPDNLKNIRIWNLRGKGKPMDKLAPILIHRYKDANLAAIIIDPIYKVITGDENNATEMSNFCSYFDQVATETGASIIYCHHHSKGASGKYANAADRSSGSGVFARDPDAIVDMRELRVDGLTDKYRKDHPNANTVLTAWEISTTLREFPPTNPFRIWFDHPIHEPDPGNYLAVATYNDSGDKGIGSDQKGKTDWYQTVEDLLAISSDTAVTLDAVGITEGNAKSKFGKSTDFEVATIDGAKVVHMRNEDEIVFGGTRYKRGKGREWLKVES